MTPAEKQELIQKITDLIDRELAVRECEPNPEKPPETDPIELLTVKQCAERVKGLSEHAIRSLAKSGEIPYITVGKSKMLIGKDDLMAYVKNCLKS